MKLDENKKLLVMMEIVDDYKPCRLEITNCREEIQEFETQFGIVALQSENRKNKYDTLFNENETLKKEHAKLEKAYERDMRIWQD